MSFKHLKYCPELNRLTGSVNATLLMLQLEYWFEKCKRSHSKFAHSKEEKFYKFLEPCEHEYYRQGDSWTEELGFTKFEFRSAFAKIGKTYKSKSAFKASKDLFEGQYYASYYDRTKGLTYYIRNNEVLSKVFEKERSKEVSKEVFAEKESEEISANQESPSPISIAIDYSESLTAVKDTYSADSSVPYEDIKELFNASCPSYPKVTDLTPKRKNRLCKLWHRLGQSMECFKKAFSLAEASDFLAGRISSWRASFDWLIQEDKFIALIEGNYESRGVAPKNKFKNTYSHNWNFEELEALESKYIDQQIEKLKGVAADAKGACLYGQI